eukprot:202070-Prorocentrum_minimum.AAC.1
MPLLSSVQKYSTGTSVRELHRLQRKRRPPSVHCTNGLMYVRHLRQRTIALLPKSTSGTSSASAPKKEKTSVFPAGRAARVGTFRLLWSRGSPGTPATHRGDTDHPPFPAIGPLGQGNFVRLVARPSNRVARVGTFCLVKKTPIQLEGRMTCSKE